jgi:hypothetical protein
VLSRYRAYATGAPPSAFIVIGSRERLALPRASTRQPDPDACGEPVSGRPD